ncbi:N-acetyltransferase GCN5 [Allostella vacuolata]|nr:N-acetyltransferase GCN5 [Stella vacuolata]
MTIVEIGPADAGWLALLHGACFPEDPWPADAWAALLGQPGVAGAALLRAGEPVGLALGRHVADEAEVLTIGVAPGQRRIGAGRALLDHLLASLPGQVSTVFLEVAADNVPAQALYANAGFRRAGTRRGYYRRAGGVAVDALLLCFVRANGSSRTGEVPAPLRAPWP